ncbi:thiamine diphosphate-binding protein [Meredithblackwellia eburnea MCA 4105]
MVFTTSHVFLKVLAEAGITHAFVNLGSDHPALLEAFAQRIQDGEKGLEIVTCPNEMVALSCAQGYAQVTGKPAAVIVHVDCGTQALAGAVHNVSVCRTPVFIYAGASPFTQDDELPGSRNEFIHYLQNAVDQPAILRQFMKHTAEIRTGKNVQQVVLRALQYAKSDPPGPVYCWAPREVTEEHLDPTTVPDVRVSEVWSELERSPMNKRSVSTIATALASAKNPLIVTSYIGRNPAAVVQLTKLVDTLAIPVFSSCPSYVNLDYSHDSHAGVGFQEHNSLVEEADVVLIIDSDVPWLPIHTKPSLSAKVFHIDVDPLKEKFAFHAYPSNLRAKADAELALEQINEFLQQNSSFVSSSLVETRRSVLKQKKALLTNQLAKLEIAPSDGIMTAPFIVSTFRRIAPQKTTVLNESISNYPLVWSHMLPTKPGDQYTSGASGLGWALGAAVGFSLAGRVEKEYKKDLLAVIVGDGSFIFGVPSAAYWIARRYETPFLTIVLNNGGWRSPKLSALRVHPSGAASKVSANDLNVSFGPDAPDYGGIAVAAGGAWAKNVYKAHELADALVEAIKVVREEKRCAVLDCWMERI